MKDLIKLFGKEFNNESFMKGIKKSFIESGFVPFDGSVFKIYKEEHFHGIKAGVAPTGTLSLEQAEISEALEFFLDNDDDIAEALAYLNNDDIAFIN